MGDNDMFTTQDLFDHFRFTNQDAVLLNAFQLMDADCVIYELKL